MFRTEMKKGMLAVLLAVAILFTGTNLFSMDVRAETETETEKQQQDKAGTDIKKTGKYSDAMLYMTAEWLLKGIAGDSFQNINNTVVEHLEPVDMEETLPGRWLVYAQTDLENSANKKYNYDAPEPYYPMFALHMEAEVSKEDTGFCMTPGHYEMLDCDTGEILVEDINETLTGDIVRDSEETYGVEEFILFDGSVQIKILGIAALEDRLYALGTLTYSSGESFVLCMIRENGAGVSSGGSGREEKGNGGKKPANGDRDAYRDSFEDAEELHTYLLQSMTYDDGVYGPSGICEAVHIRFDEKAGVMAIYEYGLFDEPDMIFPWDKDIKVPKGEYDDGDYHIRADMDAIADGAFAGLVEMPDMGLSGYFRLDPLIPLEKGQWEYDPDFEGFQWIDVAKFEENKDGHLSERFSPGNAENENIWLVNTTGETTLWDWAVYMEGYSRVSNMLIEAAGKYADENGYSMEGWKPHKRMTGQKQSGHDLFLKVER